MFGFSQPTTLFQCRQAPISTTEAEVTLLSESQLYDTVSDIPFCPRGKLFIFNHYPYFSFYFSYLYPSHSLWSPSVYFLLTFSIGREVYLFEAVSKWKASDWKADIHTWEHNGKSKLRRIKPVVAKTYYYIKIDGGISNTFQKEVSTSYESPGTVLNHYPGDESVSRPSLVSPFATLKILKLLCIKHVDVQMQRNGNDCGVLTIANLLTVLNDIDPATVHYKNQ